MSYYQERYHQPTGYRLPTEVLLRDRIGYLKDTDFYRKGEYLLPNTGFNVTSQVEQLENSIAESFGFSSEDAYNRWISKTAEDIKAFHSEYIAKNPLLPFTLRIKEVDGRLRVVAPNYDDKIVLSTINPLERKGASYESFEELERWLIAAQPGSIFIRTSPPGWTGFNYKFTETQTQIFLKTENDIKGFSIRTGMDLKANKELLERLGLKFNLYGENGDDKDQLVAISRANVFVPNVKVEEVIKIIEECAGNKDFKGHSFDEIWRQFRQANQTLEQQSLVGRYIQQFTDYAQSLRYESLPYDQLIENLKIALGAIILEIMGGHHNQAAAQTDNLGFMNIQPQDTYLQHQSMIYNYANYGQSLKQLQAAGGCSGGGNENIDDPIRQITKNQNSVLGTRGIVEDKDNKNKKTKLKCPFCHKEAEYDVCDPHDMEKCKNCGQSEEKIREKLSMGLFSLN